ncbi:hypothetical protein [Rhodopirellula europaea]|nr:hypothetical protein [Rhodopirellula europaea]
MLATRWAAPPVDSNALETLHAAEAHFPVSLISTESSKLQCCKVDETAAQAVARPLAGDFDHLPVKTEDGIIGLFSRKRKYIRQTVGDVMTPLNEKILMSADAGMIHFLEEADRRPFVFLVKGDCISGAVTLSDIQKVAARPPIFLRLTLFEILLTNWIRERVGEDEKAWLKHVSKKANKDINEQYTKRKKAGDDVDKLSLATLKPKIDAALRMGAFRNVSNSQNSLNQLRVFRNQVAHADEFGADQVAASAVPKHLRLLREFIARFDGGKYEHPVI